MKLRRGVDIPLVPLLNWNLIAPASVLHYTVCILHRCKSYDARSVVARRRAYLLVYALIFLD